MTPRRRMAPVLLVALLLSGCGGAPEEIGPQGVDGLEVPTPSPDPGDFVDGVDNPWLPLVPGSEWGYRVTGGRAASLLVTVTDNAKVVAGVRTTVVREVASTTRGRVVRDTYAWYAQDAEGNVWSFGEDNEGLGAEASWEAGVDGAEAALAMPAIPRVGDGYELEYAAGRAEDRALVVAVGEQREVAGRAYDDVLVTEVTTPLQPELVERDYFAAGTGLVLAEAISGGGARVELVRARLVASDA